jgi:hypothetical protein
LFRFRVSSSGEARLFLPAAVSGTKSASGFWSQFNESVFVTYGQNRIGQEKCTKWPYILTFSIPRACKICIQIGILKWKYTILHPWNQGSGPMRRSLTFLRSLVVPSITRIESIASDIYLKCFALSDDIEWNSVRKTLDRDAQIFVKTTTL